MTLSRDPKASPGANKATLSDTPKTKRKGLGRRLRPSVVMGLLAAAVGSTSAKGAETPELTAILNETIPAHEAFLADTRAIENSVQALCADGASEAAIPAAREALASALVTWGRLQIYTFGPVEDQNHRARVQFWPDKKNITGRQVESLLRKWKPEFLAPEVFPETSIALQGLPALTVLLHPRDGGPPEMAREGDRAGHACLLAEAIGLNLETMAHTMLEAWTDPEEGWLTRVGATAEGTGPMGDVAALDSLYLASINQGLNLVHDLKLEKPLGANFKQPRPTQAESPETGMSLAMAVATMEATTALYAEGLGPKVAKVDAELDAKMRFELTDITKRMKAIEPPLSAVVGDLSRRFRVEDVMGRIDAFRARLALNVAPALGIVMGFNSLDGD